MEENEIKNTNSQSKMTKENARDITHYGGYSLHEVIKILRKYREKGESVFFEYNGHVFYSCDIYDLDHAFEKVNSSMILADHVTCLDDMIHSLSIYRKDGENAYGVYDGHRIYSCDINDVDYVYREVYGMSKKEWEEQGKENAKNLTKENAKDIPVLVGDTIYQVVKTLLDCRHNGESAVANFNGHKLYSSEIESIADAFAIMDPEQAYMYKKIKPTEQDERKSILQRVKELIQQRKELKAKNREQVKDDQGRED